MNMNTTLGYIGVSSSAFREWLSFGPEVLGLEVVEENDHQVLLTLDDQRYRLLIQDGPTDRLDFIGWDVGNEENLERILEILEASNLAYKEGDDELKEKRRVLRVIEVEDGVGLRHEIFIGPQLAPRAFRPGRAHSGFVTANQGMGHAVIVTPDRSASDDFFRNVLGMKKSDEVHIMLELLFYHCNPRHHSAAIAVVPGMRGLHHLMFEARELDDVGIAYDLCRQRNMSFSMTLGRHTNDRMLSFYVRSPSGFDIEYGWGGLSVNEDWKIVSYDRAEIWGHVHGDNGLPGTVAPI